MIRSRRPKVVDEYYRCPFCGYSRTINRLACKRKEKLHKKWLFCVGCQKNRDFVKYDFIPSLIEVGSTQ